MLKIRDDVDLIKLEKFGFEIYSRLSSEFYKKN